MFVLASSALPYRWRTGTGQGVCSAGCPLPAAVAWTKTGSPRFPGDPSHAFAPVQDPGRTDATSPGRSHRYCPRKDYGEGSSDTNFEATHAASASAAYASRAASPPPRQGSLPAGWLAFAGRVSNPLDRSERFQNVMLILLSRAYPGAKSLQRNAMPPSSAVTSRRLEIATRCV
jgi:hypothetical protein